MLLSSEYAQEPPEHHLKTAPCLTRWQFRNGLLFSDHELQLGHHVHDELAVRAQRFDQRVPPATQLRLALAQQPPEETLERLPERGIRDVAIVLVELAGGEEATRRDEH